MKRMIGTKIILWAIVSLFILMGSSMLLPDQNRYFIHNNQHQDSGLLDVLIQSLKRTRVILLRPSLWVRDKPWPWAERRGGRASVHSLMPRRNLWPKVMASTEACYA